MSALTYATTRAMREFGRSFVQRMPERRRFAIERLMPSNAFDCVDIAPQGSPGVFRWRCPDPDYSWHHGVDDLGWADDRGEAVALAALHVAMHHATWEPDSAEHEAWDEWIDAATSKRRADQPPRPELAVKAEALREFADALGVDIGVDESEFMDGYRSAQRGALNSALRRADELDGQADS